MKRWLGLWLGLLLLFAEAPGQTANNAQVVQKLWQQALDSLFSGFPTMAEGDTIGLQLYINDPLSRRVLEQGFVDYFRSTGRPLRFSFAKHTIVVREISPRVTYQPRQLFWLGYYNRYQRVISVDFNGWLEENPGRKIVKFFKLHRQYRDWIDHAQLQENLTLQRNPFRGADPTPAWRKVLKPFMVVSVSLVIIYLFYSQRTG